MNNVEFVKAMGRICSKNECYYCPLDYKNNGENRGCIVLRQKYPEKFVSIVEKWAEDNPVQTRQSEMLKILPNIRMTSYGVIDLCPAEVEGKLDMCSSYRFCAECKEQYWLSEMDDK